MRERKMYAHPREGGSRNATHQLSSRGAAIHRPPDGAQIVHRPTPRQPPKGASIRGPPDPAIHRPRPNLPASRYTLNRGIPANGGEGVVKRDPIRRTKGVIKSRTPFPGGGENRLWAVQIGGLPFHTAHKSLFSVFGIWGTYFPPERRPLSPWGYVRKAAFHDLWPDL